MARCRSPYLFPFPVQEVEAGVVGPGTTYPVGGTLEQIHYQWWRVRTYAASVHATLTDDGTVAGYSQQVTCDLGTVETGYSRSLLVGARPMQDESWLAVDGFRHGGTLNARTYQVTTTPASETQNNYTNNVPSSKIDWRLFPQPGYNIAQAATIVRVGGVYYPYCVIYAADYDDGVAWSTLPFGSPGAPHLGDGYGPFVNQMARCSLPWGACDAYVQFAALLVGSRSGGGTLLHPATPSGDYGGSIGLAVQDYWPYTGVDQVPLYDGVTGLPAVNPRTRRVFTLPEIAAAPLP